MAADSGAGAYSQSRWLCEVLVVLVIELSSAVMDQSTVT